MRNCSDCKNNGTQICSVCCSYQGYPDRWEAKPKTNADRIRNTTDEEELADLLLSIQCSVCVFQGYCDDDETPNHSKICKNKILEWLKQEAET